MKQYICLNHGECNWADETPPREFPLPDGDEHFCPNCESRNIRAVLSSTPRQRKAIPFILGAIVAVGLLLYFLTGKSQTNEGNNNKGVTVVDDKHSTSDNNKKDKDKYKDGSRHEDRPKVRPVTYRKVEGSGFCDPGTCTYVYSETDNLGHTRERKIDNYAECCPADK